MAKYKNDELQTFFQQHRIGNNFAVIQIQIKYISKVFNFDLSTKKIEHKCQSNVHLTVHIMRQR